MNIIIDWLIKHITTIVSPTLMICNKFSEFNKVLFVEKFAVIWKKKFSGTKRRQRVYKIRKKNHFAKGFNPVVWVDCSIYLYGTYINIDFQNPDECETRKSFALQGLMTISNFCNKSFVFFFYSSPTQNYSTKFIAYTCYVKVQFAHVINSKQIGIYIYLIYT